VEQPAKDERIKVLLVEDDRFTREYIQEWLGRKGYDVVLAADGQEALETFDRERPSIMLLDLGIPKLDGLSVLERVHRQSPTTPVIIVSGRSDISAAIQAFTSGAWDYIIKPIVSLDYLERKIRNSLERRRLEEEVMRAQQRHRDLIQSLPIIIVVFDPDLQIEFINDACTAMLGYASQEILGSGNWFMDHIHPEDRDKVQSVLKASFADAARPFNVEFRFEHKKGYLVHLQAKSLTGASHEGGGPAGQLEAMIMDVTEHNFLDTVLVQREKLNTLGALSAELAHEIRNPLVPLAGFAKLLRKKIPDLPETAIILKEATRLEQLLDRISQYVKPMAVQHRKCSVNAILTFCMDLLADKLRRRSVEYRLDLDESISTINSDPDILTQVFMNLISSAIETVDPGGWVHVRTYETLRHNSIDLRAGPTGIRIQDPELLLLPLEADVSSFSIAVSYRLIKHVGGYLSFRQTESTAIYTVTLPKTGPSEKMIPRKEEQVLPTA
jgi:two-component system, NtrC family, sensor histidine kinase HydH